MRSRSCRFLALGRKKLSSEGTHKQSESLRARTPKRLRRGRLHEFSHKLVSVGNLERPKCTARRPRQIPAYQA